MTHTSTAPQRRSKSTIGSENCDGRTVIGNGDRQANRSLRKTVVVFSHASTGPAASARPLGGRHAPGDSPHRTRRLTSAVHFFSRPTVDHGTTGACPVVAEFGDTTKVNRASDLDGGAISTIPHRPLAAHRSRDAGRDQRSRLRRCAPDVGLGGTACPDLPDARRRRAAGAEWCDAQSAHQVHSEVRRNPSRDLRKERRMRMPPSPLRAAGDFNLLM